MGPGTWTRGFTSTTSRSRRRSSPAAGPVGLLPPQNLSPVGLASAGALLSFATAVRLSNGLFAAFALVVLARRLGARRALPYLAAGLSFAPVVGARGAKGYAPPARPPPPLPPPPL